jgi:hypothetical protein
MRRALEENFSETEIPVNNPEEIDPGQVFKANVGTIKDVLVSEIVRKRYSYP